jgi:hypothetical protein
MARLEHECRRKLALGLRLLPLNVRLLGLCVRLLGLCVRLLGLGVRLLGLCVRLLGLCGRLLPRVHRGLGRERRLAVRVWERLGRAQAGAAAFAFETVALTLLCGSLRAGWVAVATRAGV